MFTLENIGGAHVNLGHHHKDWNIECQCQAQVLLGHANNASIASNLHQSKVGGKGRTIAGRQQTKSKAVYKTD